jgi:excisionase family DNA binding protein
LDILPKEWNHFSMTLGENEESFLTVAEVAEKLRLNQQTVRNWIDAGSLPALRVGRRVLIKRSDLDRILEDAYRGTPPPPRSDPSGPSADDFWGGEPVGGVEPGSVAPVGGGSTADHDVDQHEDPEAP